MTYAVTLHRAFDVCRDPFKTMRQAKELGVHTILTSGQGNTCLAGRDLLEELVKKAGDDIEIMVGSGVDAKVIRGLYPQVKAHAWHMSGKMTLDSQMRYRKEDVNMGLPTFSEFEVWRTSEEKVRAAVEALKEL